MRDLWSVLTFAAGSLVSPAAALVVLVTCGAGCRKETIDKPDAPGMDDVLDALNAPNGTFDTATAGAVRAGLDDATNGLLGAGLPDRILEGIRSAIAAAEKDGKNTTEPKAVAVRPGAIGPRAFVGEGFGRITRICDGWGAEPAPDPANGRLALTFTFAETGLDPIVWGDVEACLYLLGPKRLRLEPGKTENDLRLYVGETRKVADLGTTPVVLALDVVGTLDDRSVSGRLVVRFVAKAKAVELLVPVSDGNVVVTVDGGSPSTVRAKNGTFQCDAQRRCKSASGAEVVL